MYIVSGKGHVLHELAGSGSGLALAHPSLFISKCPQKPVVWGRDGPLTL